MTQHGSLHVDPVLIKAETRWYASDGIGSTLRQDDSVPGVRRFTDSTGDVLFRVIST